MRNLYFVPMLIFILLVAPYFLSETVVYLLGLTFIFIIYVVSWDLVAGQTGQVNLGHTVFIGIGGYTTALLQNSYRFKNFIDFLAEIGPLPIWLTIILGGMHALLVGLVVGIVCLRLRGHYLALVTAILPLIFVQIINIYSQVFGGYEGFSIGFNKVLARDITLRYYIVMAVCLIILTLIYLLVNSKIGVKLRAIRDDEKLAESVGINVVKYKLMAFCISAFFAGIAGALAVHYRLTVGLDLFDIPLMLLIILAAIVGGLGNFWGAILGAVTVYLLKNWIVKSAISLARLPLHDEIVLYFLLVLLILKAPNGLFTRVYELYKNYTLKKFRVKNWKLKGKS